MLTARLATIEELESVAFVDTLEMVGNPTDVAVSDVIPIYNSADQLTEGGMRQIVFLHRGAKEAQWEILIA